MSLHALFSPASIAVIGATDRPGSVGRALMENLTRFKGRLVAVNPKRSDVLGVQAFPSLSAVGESVDLAVIVTPAPTVPGLVEECAACGVKSVLILTAGFRETGPEGAALEDRIHEIAARNGMRIAGPNCLGIMTPHLGLNATFSASDAMPGSVAFLSQSGALCTAILDWSHSQNVGFSAFVSAGSMVDIGWGDLIRHFGEDPHTRSIVIYMESVTDAARFVKAAREVAARKPIVVIKVGRTEAAARAAASHTGAMTGSDAVLDAAFKQCGILRVDTVEQLFDTAEYLSKQPLPQGSRLAILTNAGGPGALAADAASLLGAEVPDLDPSTIEACNGFLPAPWSHGNPIDVLGDADARRYADALQAAAQDPNIDGLLTILTPQAMTKPLESAHEVVRASRTLGKPLICSWMGGVSVKEARDVLNAASIPTCDYPDEAARAFVQLWQRTQRLELLKQSLLAEKEAKLEELRSAALLELQQQGRTLLTETEAKQVLAKAGLPTVISEVAASEDDAVRLAEEIGFPVVVKLHSLTLTHKTNVNGVRLNLRDAAAVRDAWRGIRDVVPEPAFDGVAVQPMITKKGVELILGSSTDSQFGPVLLFGAGGTLTEVWKDTALMLPPLNTALANHWLKQTRISKAVLKPRDGRDYHVDALLEVMVRFSRFIAANPCIAEEDINPLLATTDGPLILDARIVLKRTK